MQQKQGKASLSLKFLVSVQELSMKRWIISLNISPDQNLSKTWRSGQRLKLDSGEKIVIPAVIRTVIPSRIIRQYLDYCKEQEFEPASQRSLYRMIEVCSASMQKSLQGLDNTTAEGTGLLINSFLCWRP